MADERLIVTSRGLCRIPEGDDGIPVEEFYPEPVVPPWLRGTKVFETPEGVVLGKPLDAANDQAPSRSGFRPERTRSRSATPNFMPGWSATTRT